MPSKPLGSIGTTILGCYLIIVVTFLIFLLVHVWPVGEGAAPAEPNAAGGGSVLEAFLPRIQNLEVRYIVLALITGALGSTIRASVKFAAEAPQSQITPEGTWEYILQTFLGGVLAFLVYGAIRGGILSISISGNASTGGPVATLNPFGVAALAGIVGLSAPLALRRLEVIIDAMFGRRA